MVKRPRVQRKKRKGGKKENSWEKRVDHNVESMEKDEEVDEETDEGTNESSHNMVAEFVYLPTDRQPSRMLISVLPQLRQRSRRRHRTGE